MKHDQSERNRRRAHGFMLSELSKRLPVSVLERTGYQSELNKPPGKNRLYLAMLFQLDFDLSIENKLVAEKEWECKRAEKAERHNRNLEHLIRGLSR
jgi:hypothetical protein